MKSIVVLVSGNGSNLQAIIDACETNIDNGKVTAVFSNKATAYA
ncbi:phosphoribosylglycinamide formyltransferase [Vibrio astriarenae]|nr:phosphoribosylglycinamide formyltransferase [Vibrio sp. C7]